MVAPKLRASKSNASFAPEGLTWWPLTARMGRAHSDRARSVSKKGRQVGPSFPPPSLFFLRALRYTPAS